MLAYPVASATRDGEVNVRAVNRPRYVQIAVNLCMDASDDDVSSSTVHSHSASSRDSRSKRLGTILTMGVHPIGELKVPAALTAAARQPSTCSTSSMVEKRGS